MLCEFSPSKPPLGKQGRGVADHRILNDRIQETIWQLMQVGAAVGYAWYSADLNNFTTRREGFRMTRIRHATGILFAMAVVTSGWRCIARDHRTI